MDYRLLLSAPPILAVCVTLTFSIVLAYRTKWRASGYILLMTLAAGWNAGVAVLFFTDDPAAGLIVCRLIHACIALMIAVFYTVMFRDTRSLERDSMIVILTGALVSLICILPIGAIVVDVKRIYYLNEVTHFYGIPGQYYSVFVLYLVLVLSFLVNKLLRLSAPISFRERVQRRYLYALSAIAILGGVNDFFPYLGIGTYPGTNSFIYPFGSIGASAWVLGITYAERRYSIFQLVPSFDASKMKVLTVHAFLYVIALTLIGKIVVNSDPQVPTTIMLGVGCLSILLVVALDKKTEEQFPHFKFDGLAGNLDKATNSSIANLPIDYESRLGDCVDLILSHLTTGKRSPTAVVVMKEDGSSTLRSYFKDSRGARLVSTSVPSGIAYLPFKNDNDLIINGIDVDISAMETLKSYFPSIDNSYVWLRHYYGNRSSAVTAFQLTDRPRALSGQEQSAVRLLLSNITFLLRIAVGQGLDRILPSSDVSKIATDPSPVGGTNRTVSARSQRVEGPSGHGMVAGAVAHDIRSHLSLLQIEVGRLRRALKGGMEPPISMWEHIDADLKGLRDLLGDLTEYSCAEDLIETGQEVTLGEVFDFLKRRFSQYEEAGVRFSYSPTPEITVPSRFLEIILSNLIENAVHSAQAVDRGRVSVYASFVDDKLTFEISDNGAGFSARALRRVFSAGSRPSIPSSIDNRVAGTGLGLILVKHFVETVGGSIHVNSVPQVSTEFIVHLPWPLGLPIEKH